MSLSDISVTGANGTTGGEGDIILNNLFGTNTVTGSTFSGGVEDNFRVQNDSGTLSGLTVSNSSFLNNSTTSGNQGFGAFARLTANMTVTVQNSTFQGNRTIAIRGDGGDSSTLSFTATGNTISAGTSGNNQGNQGIEVDAANNAQVTFKVENNKVGTIDGTTAKALINTGINIFNGTLVTSGTPADIKGTIKSNVVINDPAAAASSSNGFGIRLFNQGYGTMEANVDNNTVSGVNTDYGIFAEVSSNSGSAANVGHTTVAVTNNTANVNSGALDAIRVQARGHSIMDARIASNHSNGGGSGFRGLEIRQAAQTIPAGGTVYQATFNLEGLTTGLQTNYNTIVNYLQSKNPAITLANTDEIHSQGITGVASISGVPPLLIASGGVQPNEGGGSVATDPTGTLVVTVATDPAPATAEPIANALNQLYRELLGRNIDDSGIATYSALLNGGVSVAAIRSMITASSEEQLDLNLLYRQVFDRDIDASGKATYTEALANGASLAQVEDTLAHSPEGQNHIQQVYFEVLGRAADADGLATYTASLAHDVSLDAIRNIIAHSPEAAAALTGLFGAIVGRAPTDDEVAAMADRLGAGASLLSLRNALSEAVSPGADNGSATTGGGTDPSVAGNDDQSSGDGPIIDPNVLTAANLGAMIKTAIARWEATRLTPEQDAYLHNLTFSVGNLGGITLGSAAPGLLKLDDDAGGNGWYIDPTPGDDSEFPYALTATNLLTDPSLAPAGRVDLLTTVMHELGHELGLDDLYAPGSGNDLMYGYIITGERRLPFAGEANGGIPGNILGEDFALAPVSIGTLPAGKSVTVSYDLTVDPQTNQLILNPVNSGTVSSPDLTSSVTTNTVTTMLDTLVLGDHVFNDVNRNGIFDTGDSGISGVALTLFADTNSSGNLDAGDAQITNGTTTTGAGGVYSFTGLAPGSYIVRVDAANFTSPGALNVLRIATTPAVSTPDNNTDNDSNGIQAGSGQIVATAPITLAYNTESTNGTGNDTNNTLDIGVFSSSPVLTASGGTTAASEQVAIAVDSSLGLTDPDSSLVSATITITGNFQSAEDQLSLTNNPATMGNIAGSYAAGVLTLSSSGNTATLAQWQAALDAVAYTDTSNTPNTSNRTLSFVVNDGISNSNTVTKTVSVTAVNDAPVPAAPVPHYSTTEQTTLSLRNTGLSVSDVDGASAVERITLSVVEGTLSATAGTTGVTIISGSGTSSLVVDGTIAQLNSFLSTGTGATLTYIDSTDAPSASTTLTLHIDDKGNTGTGGAQTADATATIDITAVNDAPVLDPAKTPVLGAENEDAGAPTGAVGTLVSSLVDLNPPLGGLDNATDADGATAVTGIALTATDTSHGSWFYTTDGGGNWIAVGTVSAGSALLLKTDANTRLYFNPTANFNGPVASAITFRAWDQSSGAAGNKVDTSTNGGGTAFSTATDTADLTITAVNDAPVAAGTATLAAINEDTAAPTGATVSSLFSANFSDSADQVAGGSNANTFAGIAIGAYTPDASKGDWQYSIDNGVNWTSLGSASTDAAITLNAADKLRFLPAANYNGPATAISANLIESGQTIASAATIDLTGATGGSTHISAAAVALSETITAVNDAPVLDPAKTPVLATENQNAGAPAGAVGTLVSDLADLDPPPGGLDNVTDVDSGALTGIALTATDTSEGTWFYTVNGGTNWDPVGAVSAGSALLLAPDANTRLYLDPTTNFIGTVSNAITFRAWDQTSGTAGSTADTSSNGSTTAFSTSTDTADISIACYCRGTLILTPAGEIPVEQLAIGDLVVTVSGECQPIRWIGQRAYAGRFVAGDRDVLPICVKPDAIAKGLPARDLWVSPGHALYIEGVLVTAKDLVNGATVIQTEQVEELHYFHIELETHDVIYADGMPAESYVDCDNRMMFANGHEYADLYPEDQRSRWLFCAPRLEWGSPELRGIRKWMLERAAVLGYIDGDVDALDPDLHLLVDGVILRPSYLGAHVYRFDLPAGSTAVWLRSRVAVPAQQAPDSDDRRRLGVALDRVVIYDRDLRIEAGHGHTALCEGFYEDEQSRRWTDGFARLPEALFRPFADAFSLEVHLIEADLRYGMNAPARATA